MLKSAIALAIATATAAPALANDSTAELSTGGLVFVRNEDVEMRSEDLFISAKEISVRYRFFNRADQNMTVLVAFPMPEIRVDGPDDNISVPTEEPVNFLAFATTVNGEPVKTKVEQRAIAVGIDRTQLLRSLGVPLAPHLHSTNEALDRLPPEKWDELVRIGVAEIEEYDAGQGMKKHLAARWGLQTTYYWEQTFPAKAETVIEHRYKPSVGASVQTALGSPNEAKEPGTRNTSANIAWTMNSSPRSSARAGRRTASSARPTARSASITSSRPAPTGRGRSRSSVWSSTKARPTAWSASAAKT